MKWLVATLALALIAVAPAQQTADDTAGPSAQDTLAYINQSFLPGDVHYSLSLSADGQTLTWTEVDPDGTTLTRTAPVAALDPSRIDPAINGTVGDLDVACRQGSACARAGGKPVNSFYVQGFQPDDDPLADAQDAMHHLLVVLQAQTQKL